MTVEILGRPLTLKSNLPPEQLQAVARLVNDHLRQLQQALPASPVADLAILAALNLAEELLEIKEDYQQLQSEIEARSRDLIQRLEDHDSLFPPGP